MFIYYYSNICYFNISSNLDFVFGVISISVRFKY